MNRVRRTWHRQKCPRFHTALISGRAVGTTAFGTEAASTGCAVRGLNRLAVLTLPAILGRCQDRGNAELRAQLGRLREARVDASMLRIDTLCGRLALPTTYRLSRFAVGPACDSDHSHSDR